MLLTIFLCRSIVASSSLPPGFFYESNRTYELGDAGDLLALAEPSVFDSHSVPRLSSRVRDNKHVHNALIVASKSHDQRNGIAVATYNYEGP